MEEPYKTDISKELKRLLSELEVAETQPQMQALLAETMAYILKHTSDSSSMTEIANALWDAKDTHTQSLAKLINTSSWREPDWSDYAEKYTEFRALYENAKGEGEEAVPEETAYANLKWMLESSSLKMKNALSFSGIDENDALYKIIGSLAFSDGSENGNEAFGFEVIVKKSQHLGYSECGALLANTFEYMSEKIYAVIAQQKVNTNVGEHAMTKLSTLFLVPLPGFERPDFVKNGDLGVSDSGGKDTDDNNENQSQGGGIGTGATYGSNDLVLDPLTGEYVEYGTLLAKYYSIMSAKLESGNYSEQQKDAIIKYFNLLYGGMKKDEDK